MLMMLIVRKGRKVPSDHPLRNPLTQKCLRLPTQWIAAMSCRRPSLSGPACAWTPHGLYMWGVSFPMEASGGRSEINIEPTLGAPLLIYP